MRAALALMSLASTVACVGVVALARADEPSLVLAGPAMGTTYRVMLAEPVPGLERGEVHREVEMVLDKLDRALSTWREDSDSSRFNRAAPGEWVAVSPELVAIIEIAREVHEQSAGAFDMTVASAATGRVAGMRHLRSRADPPAIMKEAGGLALDLGGIGPGYAVDAIGARLVEIGSPAHLVELGGEVRAWGEPAPGRPWRVLVRQGLPAGGVTKSQRLVELASGAALGTATCRPGRSPLDPRTGLPCVGTVGSITVRAASCAAADAWAVAAIVLGLEPEADGLVTAPSRPAAPPGARRAAP
jgi:thiamine biosynthesis lipoprotein